MSASWRRARSPAAMAFLRPARSSTACAAEGTLAGDKALILRPQTYMNDSGRAVQAAMQFYKVEPNDLTVLYDEIDLRVRQGAGQEGRRRGRP